MLKSSNASKALHLDRTVALATGAIVMAHPGRSTVPATRSLLISALVSTPESSSSTISAVSLFVGPRVSQRCPGGTARVDLTRAVKRNKSFEFTDRCRGAIFLRSTYQTAVALSSRQLFLAPAMVLIDHRQNVDVALIVAIPLSVHDAGKKNNARFRSGQSQFPALI